MWIIFLSTCVCISLVMSLGLCLCWKKKNQKDEWLGINGMVTQKNPDENVNHLPATTSCMEGFLNGETVDGKRNSITNTRRSLPDIPADLSPAVIWEPNGDNSSEHYATLGQYQTTEKKISLSNGPEVRPSISQQSSGSQANDSFAPYERVKYDKIKSKEHPYAQLQPTPSRSAPYEESKGNAEETSNLLSSTNAIDPPTIRSRRSSTHSGGEADIPAATAVAGGIAASVDLPYMTPPVTQANFSGDSQDSSKGYTSISVREPLANILAQTKDPSRQKKGPDMHYSTVSDDSDDVYTTIPDPNSNIYTSESETYARIPPLPVTVEVEINNPPSERRVNERLLTKADQHYELPSQPAPPSVDSLKQVASHSYTHSRQASSSSSVANLGSPKPEKRQANSPLPPPPTTSNFDIQTEKLQVMRNLDDLYAKVHKNKRDNLGDERINDVVTLNELLRNSVHLAEGSSINKALEEQREHNYETLKQTKRNVPNYEKIQGSSSDCEPGYASITGPDNIESMSDTGYEVLGNRTPSDIDPNYEQLRDKTLSSEDGYSKIIEKTKDGYSIVNKKKKLQLPKENYLNSSNSVHDPNYESMPNEIIEPNYAQLKSSGSDTDPNYESVNNSDPNYESVRDLKPYERLEEDSSRTNSEISGSGGYERIRHSNISSNMSSGSSNSINRPTDSEPPYERLKNDVDCDTDDYESVHNVNVKEGNSSGSSGNEVGSIQNEIVEGNLSEYIHEEDVVVQV